MYKPKKVLNSSEIVEFIEGNDVYNSAFISQLQDITDTETYICKRSDKRLDLIAENIIGNSESILAILNKFTKGDKYCNVKYLSSNQISKIIASSMK